MRKKNILLSNTLLFILIILIPLLLTNDQKKDNKTSKKENFKFIAQLQQYKNYDGGTLERPNIEDIDLYTTYYSKKLSLLFNFTLPKSKKFYTSINSFITTGIYKDLPSLYYSSNLDVKLTNKKQLKKIIYKAQKNNGFFSFSNKDNSTPLLSTYYALNILKKNNLNIPKKKQLQAKMIDIFKKKLAFLNEKEFLLSNYDDINVCIQSLSLLNYKISNNDELKILNDLKKNQTLLNNKIRSNSVTSLDIYPIVQLCKKLGINQYIDRKIFIDYVLIDKTTGFSKLNNKDPINIQITYINAYICNYLKLKLFSEKKLRKHIQRYTTLYGGQSIILKEKSTFFNTLLVENLKKEFSNNYTSENQYICRYLRKKKNFSSIELYFLYLISNNYSNNILIKKDIIDSVTKHIKNVNWINNKLSMYYDLLILKKIGYSISENKLIRNKIENLRVTNNDSVENLLIKILKQKFIGFKYSNSLKNDLMNDKLYNSYLLKYLYLDSIKNKGEMKQPIKSLKNLKESLHSNNDYLEDYYILKLIKNI